MAGRFCLADGRWLVGNRARALATGWLVRG